MGIYVGDEDAGPDRIDESSDSDFEEIDQKIASLEAQLQQLRAQRNLKTPMTRLPVEVMAHIFSYCVPSQHFSNGTRWLAFTQVCRSWRTIAVNHVSLWTYIDFSYQGVAQMMLERSKNAALDLDIPRISSGHSAKRWQGVLNAIQSQVHRVRRLRLDVGYSDTMRTFLRGLEHAAPSLFSLEITNVSGNLDLSSTFLAGEAPLLSELRLQLTYLPWDSPLLQNLTQLVLFGDGYRNLPTGQQFLDVLRRMPMLEVLELKRILPCTIEGTEVVSLPRLRNLSFMVHADDMTAEGCTAVLMHLSFPETTALDIYGYSRLDDAGVFNSLLSQLSVLFSSSASRVESPRTVKSLCLALEVELDCCRIAVEAWNTDIPVTDVSVRRNSLSNPIISLDFEWERPHSETILDDIKAVITSLTINSLESLYIQGHSDIDDDTEASQSTIGEHRSARNILTKTLGPVLWSNSVKTLGLDGFDHTRELPDLLSMTSSSTESPIQAFPSVRTLVLSSTALGSEGYDDDGERSLLDLLLDILKSRSQNNQKVEKLVLRYCDILSQEQTALLRQVVGELDWDAEKRVLEMHAQVASPEDEL